MKEHDVDAMKDIKDRLDKVLEKDITDTFQLAGPESYLTSLKILFRIAAGIALCFSQFIIAGILFILAEMTAYWLERTDEKHEKRIN